MANTNTLTTVIPQLLAQGLLALRQMAIMPRFVNRGYETLAGEKGSVITIPIPSAITATAVSPSYVPPDDLGVVPTSVSIPLNQWWEAPFFLSDQDMLQAMSGTIPMQASEAIKSLANKVDNLLLGLFVNVYSISGIPGTTPFGVDLNEFLTADQLLNDSLAPVDNRYVVINSRAKANAMGLRAFQDAAWRGDQAGIAKGDIGEKLGAFWALDQNIPRVIAGTITTGLAVVAGGGGAVAGNTTFTGTTAASTGACALLAGDIINIAGHSQSYVLTSAATQAVAASNVTINISPGLQLNLAGGEAITVKGNHTVNLMFHRDAFALASRPFAGADPMGLGTYQSAVDPVSGLALRLEVTRQHKRTRFSYDILFGVASVRPQLACRIAGE